jgi:hypothetical protein
MTSYRVTPVRQLRNEALMMGGFAVVVSAVIVLATGSWPGVLLPCVFVGAAGGLRFATRLLEIEVHDGVIEFRRFLRRSTVAADQVRAVAVETRVDEDGDIFSYLRLAHAHGRIEIPYLADAGAFVAQLRKMNAAITISGTWPTRQAR